MKLLRLLPIWLAPITVAVACGDDEKPSGGGDDSTAGESGRDGSGGSSGTAGTTRGGTSGTGAEPGESGMGGEPTGGTAGSSGRGGAGTGGAGSGAGGSAGSAGTTGESGAGAGGEGGASCTTMDLALADPNFDANIAGWTPYDTETGPPRVIIVPAETISVTAESPPNVAYFGGVNDASAGMFQPIAIPDGAVTVTLTGYAQLTTEETASAPLDVLTIQLWEDADTTTGLIGDFAVFTNENPTTEWVAFTGTVDVEAYAGDTVELDMWAETDGSLITEFYVDSLGVTVNVCL
jgi:hypothetical protein